MPRKEAVQVDNKFIRGLITETTALSFPEDACTETWNCEFNRKGEIKRRLGFDYEAGATIPGPLEIGTSTSQVMTEFLWETSEGTELKSFVVIQLAGTLFFYDVSNTSEVGDNYEASYTILLDDYTPTVSLYNPGLFPCEFAQGNNQLVVVNKGTDPLVISYNSETDLIETQRVTLRFRDFDGVEDGLDLNERPTSTLADLITNNPSHYYNLLNQGWHAADALDQWDTARADMPSNADQVNYYRSNNTDIFNGAIVLAYSSLANTPASKGHFILEVGNTSRTSAMSAEGFSASIPGEAVDIGQAVGSIIGNATARQSAAFDTTVPQAAAAATATNLLPAYSFTATSSFYTGKDFSGVGGKQILQATVVGPSDNLLVALGGSGVTIHMELRGHSSPPSTGLEGTLLGSRSLNATTQINGQSFSIGSSDSFTSWDYVWVAIYAIGTTGSYFSWIAEMTFSEPITGSTSIISYHRPSATAFYAGRAWYSGIEDGALNNNIYFSRIILQDGDYGKCYQANDPTSEFISDLLPDDGGVLKLIEVSRIIKLVPYQNSLLVFATNGVWRIAGSAGFSASDYSVRKISSIGIDSAHSLVSVEGNPIWFAEQGIYTVEYNSNYDAFSVKSITDQTIKSFIQEIPRANRKYIKGSYDLINNVVQWIYNIDDVPDGPYIYNRVLVLNTLTGAFYPHTISEVDEGPRIRGILYIRDANRNQEAVTKYITTTYLNATRENIYFSEMKDDTYTDWVSSGFDTDYESYFITGYKLHGETQRFNQIKYIFVFLNTEADSSCYVQSIGDFTNSGNSGKWSTTQQVYNSALLYRDVNFRRLKIRGKGRAIQLKFKSQATKPFTIIGWSIDETQNASV